MRVLSVIPLLVVFAVVLGCVGEADAEPNIFEDGSVETVILLTPEFDVDVSEFADTGEIILDIKFENTGNSFVGLKNVIEASYDGLDDPDEVYEKYADERRFYIYIDDENGDMLDIESITVTSNDDFILPHGVTEKYDDRSVVEVLDIDDLVTFTGAKAKLETQLRLSSPELVAGNDCEFKVWTETKFEHDPIIFTLPISEPTPAPMEMPKDAEEAEKLQESKIIPETKEIPKFVKDLFTFYANGEIGDAEIIGALQYLIKEGIIKV